MKKTHIQIIVALLALAVAISVGVGQYLGKTMAKDVQARLQPIWPDIETMAQEDRALLGVLAWECELLSRENSRSETLDCLRSAANLQRAQQLKADPSARLELLIERAAPTTKN